METKGKDADMNKKTKLKFVYQKKTLKEKSIYGLDKGEVDSIMKNLSKAHNVPIGEIHIEID